MEQKNDGEQKKLRISFAFAIPMRSIWSFIGFIFLSVFIYFQAKYYLFPEFKEGFLHFENEVTMQESMGFFWVLISSYFLISSWVCSLLNIFKELKESEEDGLICFLIIMGFICLALLMLVSISPVIFNGLKVYGIMFLVFIVMLGFGLFYGLVNEFKSHSSRFKMG